MVNRNNQRFSASALGPAPSCRPTSRWCRQHMHSARSTYANFSEFRNAWS